MMIDYKILSSGSKGNAVVIDNKILIDCGVPFKELQAIYRDIKIVLLTHKHTDHFKRSVIKKLAIERPSLRFACCHWLVSDLLYCGVDAKQIDVLETDKKYQFRASNYGPFIVQPFFLKHDVPNCGYKIELASGGKLIYATDCNTLEGISAPGYDLYLIEANYTDEDIEQRIAAKKENGDYSYEIRAKQNHLSKKKADDWLYKNISGDSIYVYMHQHEGDVESEQNVPERQDNERGGVEADNDG